MIMMMVVVIVVGVLVVVLTIARCEVTTLCHEPLDDTMESAPLKMQWLPRERTDPPGSSSRTTSNSSFNTSVANKAVKLLATKYILTFHLCIVHGSSLLSLVCAG